MRRGGGLCQKARRRNSRSSAIRTLPSLETRLTVRVVAAIDRALSAGPLGVHREAHVPAPQYSPQADARVSRPDGDAPWPEGAFGTPQARPEAAHGEHWAKIMKPQGFPRALRLRRRAEFLRVQGSGEKFRASDFLVFVKPVRRDQRPLPGARIGVTVTRKVGPAVTRNRIKRLVREAYRKCRESFAPGFDMVWVAKRGAENVCYAAVLRDMQRVADRLKRHARAGSP